MNGALRTVVLTVAASGCLLSVPLFAHADPAEPAQLKTIRETLQKVGEGEGQTYKTFDQKPITTFVGDAIKMILAIIGVIFLTLVVYSGFEWLTSGGDEKKVTTARGILEQGIVGLMIVMGAYVITIFVTNALQQAAGV
ncbi:MAG: hypothetical protein AAB416_00540 [Patescibacteria group bacterium]